MPRVGGNILWPPVAAAVVAPFTLLPLGVAEIVMGVLGLGCFAAALYVVRVRDWRVYGTCCLWPSGSRSMRVSHFTPLLAFRRRCVARARSHDNTRLAGGARNRAEVLRLAARALARRAQAHPEPQHSPR